MDEHLEFAIGIAHYAGDVMLKYFNKNINVKFKEDRTPVTEVDKMINSYLIEKVKEKYPNYGVDGEEETLNADSKYLWVCDPIDGTSMYTRGVPVSVFSLALVIDGEVMVGVVYDPFLDKMYSAIKGKGAFCNGEAIHVDNKNFNELGCTVDYCMWNNAKWNTFDLAKNIMGDVKLCQVASVAHASMLVASGKVSAEVFPGVAHANCDIAASSLIVEEAGGIASDFYGNKQRYDKSINGALLTNKIVHKELVKRIKDIYKEDK